MRFRYVCYMVLVWLCCAPLWAQDTVWTIRYDTIEGQLYQHTDTFRLQDQEQHITASDIDVMTEQLMMDLLEQQAAVLYSREDSLRLDSLRAVQDSLHRVMLDSIRLADERYLDSLHHEAELARQQQAALDSILTWRDSVSVERCLVQDAEEERLERLRKKRAYSPWYKEATGLLQFSQSFVSSNWSGGGNSSFALLGILKGQIKFDNKQWIVWENTGEWRAGVNTISGDSLRKMNVSDDLFKLYTKLGIKILNGKLYGTVTGDFQTHFCRTWKSNTYSLKTGPFSPVRFNLGVGIEYTQVKNLSLVVSPFAYKMICLPNERTSPSDFGMKDDQRLLNQVGSSVRVKYKWKPLREIALDTEFYFYTNYHMVELDWEVTCDFIINRFLSARVNMHPRFDSSVILDGDTKPKMQFKELISIGFSHRFR